ncbi:hypothetical protein OSB04_017307 [Centaurea solstitialis]|uniref:Uncharacterized protein n=1 Tax=Centaurea solstitialis TaxID=347529 RepID=A0AA38WAK6_9ASTR|nr:hypothetical protein OSB04_017307 [Centaurea solstitialis]
MFYVLFCITELLHLTNLEELDLSGNNLNVTPNIQGKGRFSNECIGLSRLKKLKSISLGDNNFNKSIISCLSALPSLNTLDLSSNHLRGSFPIQGMF